MTSVFDKSGVFDQGLLTVHGTYCLTQNVQHILYHAQHQGKRMFLVYKTSPKEFVWTASAPLDMIEAAGVSVKAGELRRSVMDEYADAKALERCRRVLTSGHSFPSTVLQTLDASDVGSVTEHGQYTHTPDTLPTVCIGPCVPFPLLCVIPFCCV